MINIKIRSMTASTLTLLALIAVLVITAVSGCTTTAGTGASPDSDNPTVTQVEYAEGSEAGGEHNNGKGRESGGEHSGSSESQEGAGEHNGSREAGHSEVDGEHGAGGEGGDAELNEVAMSSPITPLDQGWNGVLGGLELSMQYDAATESIYGTVKNISNQQLCYVQAEPHLKLGQQTVGELGPEKLGNLNPGQQLNSSLSVTSEPGLVGVAYDGYVIHMEVFDCSGSGPIPHSGGEGADGGSEGSGGEGHGPGGEGGSEGGGKMSAGANAKDSEEGSGVNALTLNQTYDVVRNGARLVMIYDAPNNVFLGALENTTNTPLQQVRVEVHLSNGTELGPTTPVDLAPGEQIGVLLPATNQPFDSWTPHAEVGRNEHGASGENNEGGSEGSEAGGEHGSGGESGGEHGSGGESGGEHSG